jgi:hypothetical protein
VSLSPAAMFAATHSEFDLSRASWTTRAMFKAALGGEHITDVAGSTGSAGRLRKVC